MSQNINTINFIKRAEELHGNKYDYSKTIYIKSSEKVIIKCIKHNYEFPQSPNSHLQNHGCKKCATDENIKNQSSNNNDFIKRCEEKYPNLIDYSETKYINCKIKCIFICKKCNTKYERQPIKMLSEDRKYGCTTCNGGVKDTKEFFIEKANKTHNNQFNYDLVKYVNSHIHVKIKCKNNHIFEQTPNHHINGDGCPFCAGKYKNFDDFIKESKEKFNDKFDYSKAVYNGRKNNLILICANNHSFTTTPEIHLRENSSGGCKLCANKKVGDFNKYSQNEWIELAKSTHNELYLYEESNYINSQTEIIITCKIHGDFNQLPVVHLSGGGCQKCGIIKSAQFKMLSDKELNDKIEICKKNHNNKYYYNSIYRENKYLKIECVCSIHGIFNKRLDHHINGSGCSKCIVNYSKKQIEWLNYCEISDGYIQHAKNVGEFRIPNTFMHADGYNNKTNTIYEFQGDFWHGNPNIFNQNDINPKTNTTYGSLYEKTQNKIKLLKNKGYNIKEIWESEWDKGIKNIIYLQKQWKNNNKQ